MPLYEYRCPECQSETESFRSVERREESPLCEMCGAVTSRRYSSPLINPVGFGQALVGHDPTRRVSKAQAEQHTHWQQTRYGDAAPPRLDAAYKPTHFTP